MRIAREDGSCSWEPAGVGAGVRIDSGAGRIVTLTLRPLSFAKRGLREPSVSLQGLLDGAADICGESDVDRRSYAEEILVLACPASEGWPAARAICSSTAT